jgi:CheY-like chemotaxis protein
MAKRILLADDSITIQKVVELTFSDGDYEVTAVNNGTKAIQKLSEMRPDIILSDIIMPEKNGYEVCEFVKSHPEFRSIPVILLTGTFEPFDPDRADKAGCDAVVTKPFESQSLIHKVEELIEHAKTQAPTDRSPAPQFSGSDSPFAPEHPPAPPAAPTGDQFSTGAFQPPPETPFKEPPTGGGETRAFPKMSFEDLSKPPEPPAPSASPWDEPAPASTGGETRAFPKMTFEDLDKPSTPPPQMDARPSSAWDDQPPVTGGETRAFPKMTFEDLDKGTPPPPTPAPVEPPSWTTMPPEPPPSTPSMWDEPPAFSGETKAFPKLTFEDLDRMKSEPAKPATPPPSAKAEEMPFTREPEPTSKKESPAMSASSSSSGNNELSDEQVDRIARRVVQLMSDTVVRNIAWEVIPDLAEMVVKERIRQLESE